MCCSSCEESFVNDRYICICGDCGEEHCANCVCKNDWVMCIECETYACQGCKLTCGCNTLSDEDESSEEEIVMKGEKLEKWKRWIDTNDLSRIEDFINDLQKLKSKKK